MIAITLAALLRIHRERAFPSDARALAMGGWAMIDSPTFSLSEHPIHLGLGATVVREPRYTGACWYQGYGEGTEVRPR